MLPVAITPRKAFGFLLFAAQVLVNGGSVADLLPAVFKAHGLLVFTWITDRFSVNRPESIQFMLCLLLNAATTAIIVKLLYKNRLRVRTAALLSGLSVLSYIFTHIIGQMGRFPRVQIISVEMATYANSPLLTILVISALTLLDYPVPVAPAEQSTK